MDQDSEARCVNVIPPLRAGITFTAKLTWLRRDVIEMRETTLEHELREISINDAIEVAFDVLPIDRDSTESLFRRRYPGVPEATIQSLAEAYEEVYSLAQDLAEEVEEEKISRLTMQKSLVQRWPKLSEKCLRSILVKTLPSQLS